jgi:hypothetical protein
VMETKTLVYVYPLLRRSTIIVLDKNDQFLLLRNSRYFKNTNFLLITFEKLDFSLMSLGHTDIQLMRNLVNASVHS